MTPAAAGAPRVEVAEATDPGRDPKKQVNEDALGHGPTRFGYVCIVCDGMGGHAGGREASTLAVETVLQQVESATDGTRPAEALRRALEGANAAVFAMEAPSGEEGGPRPGSTAVAILLHGEGTEVAHVGDSRVYLAHEGQIFQLTRDHSVVQLMVDAQVLTPHQAANHPDANKIIRALGLGDTVEVELRSQPVHHAVGDVFILCSDGLCDLVEPHEILEHVTTKSGEEAAKALVALANERGGHDNITVQLVKVLDAAKGSSAGVAKTVIGEAMPAAPGSHTAPGAPSPPGTPPEPQSAAGPGVQAATGPGGTLRPGAAPEGRAPGAGRSAPAAPRNAGRPPMAVLLGVGLAAIGVLIALAMFVLLDRDRGGHPHPGARSSAPGVEPAMPAALPTEPTPVEPAPLPSLAPPVAVPSARKSAPLPRRP